MRAHGVHFSVPRTEQIYMIEHRSASCTCEGKPCKRCKALRCVGDYSYIKRYTPKICRICANQRAQLWDRLQLLSLPEAERQYRHDGKRTAIEAIIANLLDSIGIEYLEQKRIGIYCVDFCVAERRLIIECDGEYWHSERKPGTKEKDARKNAYLASQGYSCPTAARAQNPL